MGRSVCVLAVGLLLATQGRIWCEEGEGGYAFSALERSSGGRALGMGGAFSAVADDPNALLWNPAGLAQITDREVSSTYGLLFEGQQQFFLGYAQRYHSLTAGLGWYTYGSGNVIRRDVNGQPRGEFGDWENQFLLSLASPLPGGRVLVGGTLKLLYQSLDTNRGTGMGVDLGVLTGGESTRLIQRWAVGLSVQNLGASVNWNTSSHHKDIIPAGVRIGSRLGFGAPGVDLVADLEKNTKQDWRYHLGLEGRWSMLGLRAGSNNGWLTAGGSLYLPYALLNELHYSFADDPISERGIHRVTVGMRF